MVTKFCKVVLNICDLFSVLFTLCYPDGAWNFEVTPTFLENLCAPAVIH